MLSTIFSTIFFVIALQVTQNFWGAAFTALCHHQAMQLLFVLERADWANAVVRQLCNIRGVRIMLDGDAVLTREDCRELSEYVLRTAQAQSDADFRFYANKTRQKMEALGIYFY